MSLVFSGAQNAYFDGLVAREGVLNNHELPHVEGHPLWILMDFKPSVLNENKFLMWLGQRSSAINYHALQLNSTTLQISSSGNTSTFAGITSAWHRCLLYLGSKASRTIYVDGVAGGTNTTTYNWPPCDTLNFGSRWYAGIAAETFWKGKLANVAIGCAALTSQQRLDASIMGVNPLSLPGVIRFWPLLSDANDHFNTFNLTLAGSPTFDGADRPTALAEWPPVASSGFTGFANPSHGFIGG